MMKHDEPDWNQIVNELGPCLYRYFSGVFTPARASDLVQESLIRLVQKHRQGEYHVNKGSLKSYAFGIARFVRLEAHKSRVDFDLVDQESDLDQPAIDPSQAIDQAQHLRWAIAQ